MEATTLRPGLLVSLKTQIVGNVSYKKEELQRPKRIETGQEKYAWKTERTIDDPKEFERAKVVRGKCRTLIMSVCAQSAFGLLCPERSAKRLEEAIAAARVEADAFNRKARLSRVNVYVISGKIASTDVEAMRAINSEMRDLIEEMQKGIKAADVKSIRQAANKARLLGMMLTPEAGEKATKAIEAARVAARKIVKAGEQKAAEIDKEILKELKQARTAFLDFSGEAVVGKTKAAAPAVDFEPEETSPATATPPKAKRQRVQLELEGA